jgi:hypothetical protein
MPLTEAGYERKSEATFFAEIVAEARATVDPEFEDAPDSVSGQIVGIMASKYAEADEVMEAVYGSLGSNASGAALDRIAALTNTYRKPGESDADLRLRRQAELADQGSTTVPAIRAALARLAGMDAVRVFTNRTMATDSAGRPPKSVEALVLGSTDAATIGATIYGNLAAGIEAYGTSSVDVVDSEGHTEAIGYSVADPAAYAIRLIVDVDDVRYAGDDALKQALIDFSAGEELVLTDGRIISGGVELGGTLYRSRFGAAALAVPGVISVSQVLFRTDDFGAEFVNADVALGPREYLGSAGTRGFLPDDVEIVA